MALRMSVRGKSGQERQQVRVGIRYRPEKVVTRMDSQTANRVYLSEGTHQSLTSQREVFPMPGSNKATGQCCLYGVQASSTWALPYEMRCRNELMYQTSCVRILRGNVK